MLNNKIEKAWNELLEMGTSEETLQVVTSINGYNMDSLHDILYCQYGERLFSFEEE